MSEIRQTARAYFWREEMPCVPGGAVALVLPLWRFLAVDRRSIGYTLGSSPSAWPALAIGELYCLQDELNLHGPERKLDTAICGAREDPGIEQRRHIAMHGLHVSPHAPRCLTD